MKEFDDLMAALEELEAMHMGQPSLLPINNEIREAYCAFKAAPEPLVLEQIDKDRFFYLAYDIQEDVKIIYLLQTDKCYKLPEEK
jgi:hypothetical protein